MSHVLSSSRSGHFAPARPSVAEITGGGERRQEPAHPFALTRLLAMVRDFDDRATVDAVPGLGSIADSENAPSGTLGLMDAHEWDTRYAATETMWSYDPNVFLVPRAEGLEPGRALDLGCGEGRNALWLASQGWEVTAVDFSQVAVERGRSWAEQRHLNVDFQVADVIDFRPEPGAFDLVIVFYLQLPHEEVRQVLAHAAGALAPGGTLLVVAHDLDNLEHGYGGPPTADVLYTVDLVRESVGRLKIVESGRMNRTVSTTDGDRTAIDTLVLARREG